MISIIQQSVDGRFTNDGSSQFHRRFFNCFGLRAVVLSLYAFFSGKSSSLSYKATIFSKFAVVGSRRNDGYAGQWKIRRDWKLL